MLSKNGFPAINQGFVYVKALTSNYPQIENFYKGEIQRSS